MPQYNLASEKDPYIRHCYKIGQFAEMFNLSTATFRNWIVNGYIPETPIILEVDNRMIKGIRLYIIEQFEAVHFAIIKYPKFIPRNKHYVYNYVLEKWREFPYFKQFKLEDFRYTGLSNKH